MVNPPERAPSATFGRAMAEADTTDSACGVRLQPDCWRSSRQQASASQTQLLTPQPIATPAAPNSAQPQLSVSSRGVLVSWIERSGDLADAEIRRAHGLRLDRRSHDRVGPRLVCELGRRPVGAPAAVRRHRRALAAEERAVHLRLRRAPLAFDGRGQDVVTVVSAASRSTQTEHGFASLFPMGDGFGRW